MNVLVKGMEMPKSCGRCWFNNSSLSCAITGSCIDRDDENKERLDDCPLVALPDKHGRLGDLDALCEDLLERWSVAEKRKEELIKAVMADVVTPIIACQPTIVESEEKTNE